MNPQCFLFKFFLSTQKLPIFYSSFLLCVREYCLIHKKSNKKCVRLALVSVFRHETPVLLMVGFLATACVQSSPCSSPAVWTPPPHRRLVQAPLAREVGEMDNTRAQGRGPLSSSSLNPGGWGIWVCREERVLIYDDEVWIKRGMGSNKDLGASM